MRSWIIYHFLISSQELRQNLKEVKVAEYSSYSVRDNDFAYTKYIPIGDSRESPEIRDVRSETMLSRRRRTVLGISQGDKGKWWREGGEKGRDENEGW